MLSLDNKSIWWNTLFISHSKEPFLRTSGAIAETTTPEGNS